MNRRLFIKKTSAASLVTFITPTGIVHALRNNTHPLQLEAGFKNPPPAARPYTWWHWMNGNISREGITLDLEAMKRVGIGGVQCFNVGAGITTGPVNYLSPEWVELTRHAFNEAGRLGMELDLHNCPGWSSTGGPWITPELAMQYVAWTETFVPGGRVSIRLPKPETIFDFYKDTYVLAYPTLTGEKQGNLPVIPDFAAKANIPTKGIAGNTFAESPALAADARLAPGSFIDPEKVIDITALMNSAGELNWDAPAGEWTILRLGHTAIDRKNNSAPRSGSGLECDKYSREAFEFHFNKLYENLMPVVKQWTKEIKAGLLIDSYEVGRQNWTPALPAEFRQRRGYDLIKYLPAVAGKIITSIAETERFLWDFRQTHSDLMADYYYGHMADLCKKHGIISYTEPYNNGCFDQMEVGSKVDINIGEFWIRGPHFYPSVKLAASVMHVYGKRLDGRQIVGAEAFTGDPAHSKWQEHPYTMKAQGDFMYTEGLNRFIFHRYAHQPHSTAVPGMTMGPWGFHFDRTNTWFEKSVDWLMYAARCQNILQQGIFCGDLLYFSGENVPGVDISMTASPEPAVPKGYDWDFIDREALLNRTDIRDGRITLPDGVSYRVLALMPDTYISVAVLYRLRDLVRKGMILAGEPPLLTPGLRDPKKEETEYRLLVTEIWGSAAQTPAGGRKAGAGKVFRSQPLKTVFDELNVKPDFEYSAQSGNAIVSFTHRRIDEADVYFVASRRRLKDTVTASFRVSGKQPEYWNPDTGDITPVDVYDIVDGRTIIPLQFAPCGSFLIVFRKPAGANRLIAIEKNGTPVLSTRPYPVKKPGLYKNVTGSFTVSAWVKPETDDVLTGKYGGRGISSYLFYPPNGETLYGKDHAACGLTVARNGIIVCERSAELPVTRLMAEAHLSGWTHVALVYRNGVPSVYINGRFIKEGTASGKTIHPGLGDYHQDYRGWTFEGDYADLQLTEEAAPASRILEQARKPVPGPEAPFSVQVPEHQPGRFLFFEDGQYTLHNNHGKSVPVRISGTADPVRLDGEWTVSFPEELGAPPQISLPQLISLHKHPEDGVKYFSGTATYTRRFSLSPGTLKNASKRLFLDLGRVEVIAEVTLNGKNLGTLWKPPYLIDITEQALPENNILEVKVTNLWPNRLIGDEQLPAEHEYGSPARELGGIRTMPDWYLENKPKPAGGRVTFTTWRHFTKDSPLLESGLIGPVLIRIAVAHAIK